MPNEKWGEKQVKVKQVKIKINKQRLRSFPHDLSSLSKPENMAK